MPGSQTHLMTDMLMPSGSTESPGPRPISSSSSLCVWAAQRAVSPRSPCNHVRHATPATHAMRHSREWPAEACIQPQQHADLAVVRSHLEYLILPLLFADERLALFKESELSILLL